MPFFALQIVCSPATNAIGRPRIYVATSAFGALVFPAVFLVGIASGPMGLVHAWWVAAPSLLAFTLALTLPAIDVKLSDLIRELAPVAAACTVMAAGVLALGAFISPLPYIVQLVLLALAGALLYGGTLWLAWPRLLKETWAMIREGKQDPVAAAVAI